MKIHIGSKNEIKISAIKQAISLYPEIFKNPTINDIDVNVAIFGHPKTLEETLSGAIQRAKNALLDADYSVGIESGLMAVPFTKDGYTEVSTCAIFDGKETFIGIGPAFEWPSDVTKLILKGEVDGSQAFKNLNYTQHQKLGAMEGGICGFLTNGRLTREAQIIDSFIMAMIKLEQKRLYS